MNQVEMDGAALEQPLSDTVTMTKFSVGPTDNNIYLLTDATGTLLIDAANKPERIEEVLDGRKVETIVTTHRHPDHIKGLAEMAERTGAKLICGEPDAAAIEKSTGVRNETVWTGDSVRLPGGEELEVIGLVGHTPGAITLAYAPESGPVHLFVGDSLFPGGVGKTTNPTDFNQLMDDVEERVFAVYPDETVFHPGHGKCSTLGAERPSLPEWRERGW
ncbi:MAG TPA: MBL fold metallo-hydrolase [Propionibacterium sp.]|jgi:glyoxylase-like metal-dependent hydrolase (beta-lactamase superfamily II)|nr:MBL fold metallo-hydrolase [Propionibacterium sp.]